MVDDKPPGDAPETQIVTVDHLVSERRRQVDPRYVTARQADLDRKAVENLSRRLNELERRLSGVDLSNVHVASLRRLLGRWLEGDEGNE